MCLSWQKVGRERLKKNTNFASMEDREEWPEVVVLGKLAPQGYGQQCQQGYLFKLHIKQGHFMSEDRRERAETGSSPYLEGAQIRKQWGPL